MAKIEKSTAGDNEKPPVTPTLEEVNVLTSAYNEAAEKLKASEEKLNEVNLAIEAAAAKSLELDQEIASKAEQAKQLDDEVTDKTARRDELNESLLKLTEELIGKENELADLKASGLFSSFAAAGSFAKREAPAASESGLVLKKPHIFIEGYGNVKREDITEEHIEALVVLSDGARTREQVIGRYFEQK